MSEMISTVLIRGVGTVRRVLHFAMDRATGAVAIADSMDSRLLSVEFDLIRELHRRNQRRRERGCRE